MKRRMLLGAALTLLAGAAWADDYVFTRIADQRDIRTPDAPFSVATSVGINNHGEVVFTENLRPRGGVYVGDGRPPQRVLQSSARRTALGLPLVTFSASTIDDDGTIAGLKSVAAGNQGLMPFLTVFTRTRNGVLTEHKTVGGPNPGAGEGSINGIFLTSSGAPLYRQFFRTDQDDMRLEPGRILRGNGEVLYEDGVLFDFLREPHANAGGDVTFHGRQLTFNPVGTAPPSIVRVSAAGAVTTIATVGTGRDVEVIAELPVVDAAGNVTFLGVGGFGGESIYRGNGGALTELLATRSSPFEGFFRVATNGPGDIVFTARGPVEINDFSLYDGFDEVADRVLVKGDGLDGKVVRGVRITNQSLNDRGQIALVVQFADDTVGIYRADPMTLVVPPGATNAAFVPRDVRLRRNRLIAQGTLDTGGLPFQTTASGTLRIGGANVAVTTAATKRNRGIRFSGEDTVLVVNRPASGTSRSSFTLTLTGDAAAAVDPEAELDLGFELPTFNATGRVPLAGGAYNTRRAAPLGPDIYPVAVRARLVRAGRDTLSATLCIPALPGDGDPADIAIDYAGVYDLNVDASQFSGPRRGNFTYRSGTTRVVYRPTKKTLTFVDRRLDLGSGTTAGGAVTITVTVDGQAYTTSFRVTHTRRSVRY